MQGLLKIYKIRVDDIKSQSSKDNTQLGQENHSMARGLLQIVEQRS